MISTDLLCIQVAQMAKSPDLAILLIGSGIYDNYLYVNLVGVWLCHMYMYS